MSDKLPPHDLHAEAGVLGCCLLSATECLDECETAFKAGANVFYDLRHRTIYETMLDLHHGGIGIDTITVQKALRDRGKLEGCGGLAFLSALPDSVPSAANLGYYVEIVLDLHRRRELIRVCTSAIQDAYSDGGDVSAVIGKAERSISGIELDQSKQFDGKACAQTLIDDLQRRFDLQGKRSGLSTGFKWFDELTDGLQFGEQCIVGARPSIGKTAIALNIVERVCLIDRQPTVFCTLEMSAAALMRRLLASQHRISMKALKTGTFSEIEMQAFAAFTKTLKQCPLHVIDAVVEPMNATQLCARIRRTWRKHGIKLVVIDYLQKIRPAAKHEKRTYEVGEVSGMLKSLAVETGAAFITLAQISREPDKDRCRQPRLSDLADSAQIERDADCVALLHRSDRTTPGAHLIIAKQRDGEIGIVDLVFNGTFCRFENP